MRTCVRLGVLLAVAGVVLVSSAETGASPGTTERVSVGYLGEGNLGSLAPSISADGRYVAFESDATNLVPGDTDACGQPPNTYNCPDIFVRDRQTSTTERVSVSSGGVQANGESWTPSISADGRYVAFDSDATNLVADDTNAKTDVFVHDRQTGVTERVSVGYLGEGNLGSLAPSISADGRYVAFESDATNLVSGDTNGVTDVFVHDRQTGATERVSVSSTGTQGDQPSYDAALSGNGRYVAFQSSATNLVADDTNAKTDVFVRDRQTGTTTRVSVDSAGAQANGTSCFRGLEAIRCPAISADGRYVAFYSLASNLVPADTNGAQDVFVHDLQTRATTRASVDSAGYEGNDWSMQPAISSDGRYVAFDSLASNLVAGDTNTARDVFLHDRHTGATLRVSVSSASGEGDHGSLQAAISADGRYVAFSSFASNLVPGDTNNFCGPGRDENCPDVFVHDRGIPVGGIAELPEAAQTPVAQSASSDLPYAALLAALAAAGAGVLSVGAWYARRRWVR
jgi:Tol biopolymer transport system component/cold shock CspA family protein